MKSLKVYKMLLDDGLYLDFSSAAGRSFLVPFIKLHELLNLLDLIWSIITKWKEFLSSELDVHNGIVQSIRDDAWLEFNSNRLLSRARASLTS